jgi:membrane associated rhomboid family serine protease
MHQHSSDNKLGRLSIPSFKKSTNQSNNHIIKSNVTYDLIDNNDITDVEKNIENNKFESNVQNFEIESSTDSEQKSPAEDNCCGLTELLGIYVFLVLTRQDRTFIQPNVIRKKIFNYFCSIALALCIIQGVLVILMEKLDKYPNNNTDNRIVISDNELHNFQSLVPYDVLCHNKWYQLLTMSMLNGSFKHLFDNYAIELVYGLYCNIIFGNTIYLIIFFLGGAYGGLLHCIYLPRNILVGTSCSGLSIMGAYFVWLLYNIPTAFKKHRSANNKTLKAIYFTRFVLFVYWFLGQFLSVYGNLLSPMTKYVKSKEDFIATAAADKSDEYCHAGGILQGILLGFILLENESLYENLRYFNYKALLICKLLAFVICIGIYIETIIKLETVTKRSLCV